MEILEEEKRLEQLFELYKGGDLLVWDYSLSLRRLILRLEKDSIKRPTYLIVVRCSYYCGSFVWEDLNLDLDSNIREEKNDRLWWQKIKDSRGNKEIISNGGINIIDIDDDFHLS